MSAGALTLPSDWDEASHAVAEAYFPHELRPLSASDASKASVDGGDIGPIRIARITWGAEVKVRTTHDGGYAVNIPTSGQLVSAIGSQELVASPDRAVICPPDTPINIGPWPETVSIFGVRFERDYLHREMSRLLGGSSAHLPDHLDLTGNTGGANWLKLVNALSAASTAVRQPLVTEQLAGAITTAFVLAAVPDEDAGSSASRPRIVKRVLDQMYEDPSRPWTAGEMAAVAGVGIRRLQEGFREFVGTSPRQCLVDIRLGRVREDLQRDNHGYTVADLAMNWGFTHTGRFAAAYRQKYGESPSETLRGN
jgi:AraC-like DNA-binding protein